jgi:hypothetical protein
MIWPRTRSSGSFGWISRPMSTVQPAERDRPVSAAMPSRGGVGEDLLGDALQGAGELGQQGADADQDAVRVVQQHTHDLIAHGGVDDRGSGGAVHLLLDHGPPFQEGVLTVAVKVLTEGPLLSRLWVKFSNCYLAHDGEPIPEAPRKQPTNPHKTRRRG